MPWMMTGTAGSNNDLSMALALSSEGSLGQFDGAIEIGLDNHAQAGRAQDVFRDIEVSPDEPRDDWNAKLRHLRRGLHQELGEFGKVGNAGEDVDQHDAHACPRRDPMHDGNKSRRIAAKLAGTDIAEIQ